MQALLSLRRPRCGAGGRPALAGHRGARVLSLRASLSLSLPLSLCPPPLLLSPALPLSTSLYLSPHLSVSLSPSLSLSPLPSPLLYLSQHLSLSLMNAEILIACFLSLFLGFIATMHGETPHFPPCCVVICFRKGDGIRRWKQQ